MYVTVCKRQDIVSKLKDEVSRMCFLTPPYILVRCIIFNFCFQNTSKTYILLLAKRERSVQGMDIFLKVVTSIPGIDNHDANAVISFSTGLYYSFLRFMLES